MKLRDLVHLGPDFGQTGGSQDATARNFGLELVENRAIVARSSWGVHGGVAKDNRLFINAIWYVGKTGIPWRDLPFRFGKWDTVYHRFNEWCKKGVWARVFDSVQDRDLEWLMIDSTVIRAHQHAAGMNDKENDQDLGRSRGGFGNKLHLAVDSLGLPVTIQLSPGQDADIAHAETLLGDHEPKVVLGLKATTAWHSRKQWTTAGRW